MFGVGGRATVNDVSLEFCTVLFMAAHHQYIKFPVTKEETATIIDLFHAYANCSISKLGGFDSTQCKIFCWDIISKADHFKVRNFRRQKIFRISLTAKFVFRGNKLSEMVNFKIFHGGINIRGYRKAFQRFHGNKLLREKKK